MVMNIFENMKLLVKMSCCIHAMLHYGCYMHACSAKYTLSSLIYYYFAAGVKSINLTVHVRVYLCKLTHRVLCNHDINFMTAGICEPAGLYFMVISAYRNACIICINYIEFLVSLFACNHMQLLI